MKLKRVALVMSFVGAIAMNGIVANAYTDTETCYDFGISGTNAVAMAQGYGNKLSGAAYISGKVYKPSIEMGWGKNGDTDTYFTYYYYGTLGKFPYTEKSKSKKADYAYTKIAEKTYGETFYVKANVSHK